MFEKFTVLAQANMDHYIAHPVTHTLLAVVWLVGGLALINYANVRMAQKDLELKGITIH